MSHSRCFLQIAHIDIFFVSNLNMKLNLKLKALEMGAVETLICWENLDIQRVGLLLVKSSKNFLVPLISLVHLEYCIQVTLKNHASGEEKILFLNSEQEKDKTLYTDQETGVEMELEENMPLLEWLANNYKKFGAGLEIITDRSQVNQSIN